ncbi:MAG: glycerophosphodiester phosphodiesterase [Hoeflea sp.]|uniref:glycerophosphodiester phosphodiesterase n=1 Tax=Hoeflea sp. TaxID=1940281 RepID=UPI001DAFC487|nr:glycerophosphodiester phosphodiesterase [Hoeflea sp.]MBU4529659.1 glycerophosphodiester phosphodiesterase [Alphaproteobacteria bacterium]MBU4546778.1 glycerophosphodiester phosphodiesterase [Alphaproteobacteria bacterium]MBU4551046.1 glycerophosphodiester phosphodiesterase [Alphaproteobacteria bacterium]MBV1723988.1 glycerophosphodiester phosphodiesterase [Hoeflea sp.]MBV1763265.1 glycerophosphodiester phosphodiesterase [Hoeflea sp.]
MSDKRKDLGWLTARPIAHRGYHDMNQSIWENTKSAFTRAIEANYAIECDVHIATDGVPVVFHDDDLERLCGLKGDVRERTSQELAQLRVGGTADGVMSLPALFKLVKGQVPLVVELKGRPGEDDGFADAVVECLESYDGPVALMSFDDRLLRDLKAAGASCPLGLTAEGVKPERFFAHEDAMNLGLDFMSYCVHHLPNAFVTAQRSRGVPIITWTVRDQPARQLTRQHADQMTFEGFDPDTTEDA